MGRDIVAELRTHAQVTAWNPFGSLCAAAAAEIEALRAERDAARSAIRAALDGADIAADGDGAWLDQPLVDRLRLGLERRPEVGEMPDDDE